MPLELQIIRAREFVRLGAEGKFDFAGTHAVLKTLADACRKRGIKRAMVDVRESSSNLTPNELAALVNAAREWAYDRTSHIGKLDQGLDEAKVQGWTVVSMKDDWKTIFPK